MLFYDTTQHSLFYSLLLKGSVTRFFSLTCFYNAIPFSLSDSHDGTSLHFREEIFVFSLTQHCRGQLKVRLFAVLDSAESGCLQSSTALSQAVTKCEDDI